MGFLDIINNQLINKTVVLPPNTSRNTFWPTEASFKDENGVIGKCMRQAWYERQGLEPTNPTDEKAETIFDMGNMIEDWYIEQSKRAGIWAADNVRYYDDIHNIAAKIDLFIYEDMTEQLERQLESQGMHIGKMLAGVECKSYYGNYAEKEVKEFPKIDALMQTCLYLDFMNKQKVPYWSGKFYIEYFGRDSCNKYEHVVELVKVDNLTYPVVNGVESRIFNLEGVYARYEEQAVHCNLGNPPPRDYTYAFSTEEVEKRFKDGRISKSKYMSWKSRRETVSDWRCLYCGHLDRCWTKKREAARNPKFEGSLGDIKEE